LTGGNLLIPTGPGSPDVLLDFNARFIRASGQVVIGIAGISLDSTAVFEKTTRLDGTSIIKVGLANLDLALGDPAIFNITGATGLLIITEDAIAAEFKVPVSFSVPSSNPKVSFSGTLSLAINNSSDAINETFALPDIGNDKQDNDGDGTIDEPGEMQVLQ